MRLSIFRAIDKLEKIGKNGVKNELKEIGLNNKQINDIFELINIKDLKDVKEKLNDIEVAIEGVNELEEVYKFAKYYGIENKLKFDMSLARGLDYYTGPIFEFKLNNTDVIGKSKVGTITAGGRYDNLIELFGGKSIPATGVSLGIERIIEILKLKNKLPESKTKSVVFVANTKDELKNKAIEIGQLLRKCSIPCEINITTRNLRKQLDYVNRLGIPYTIIVGERELKEDSIVLRDMKTGKENKVKIDEICSVIKNLLKN
jgi:histidyl-tRNA synthetase